MPERILKHQRQREFIKGAEAAGKEIGRMHQKPT